MAPELPWVFRVRDDGKHIYLDSGDRRSRTQMLWVAAPPGATASGHASLEHGVLEVVSSDGEPQQQRSIWLVQGVADFQWADGEARIESGYTGPDVHLQFSGRGASVHVHGCTGAYIGDPKPKRVGGLAGTIQWRETGSTQWSTGIARTNGKVTYRLVDEAGVDLAKRNIFIFPDNFDYKILHKQVELTLGADCSVVDGVCSGADKWVIEFGADQDVVVPINISGAEIRLRFERPRPTSFVNVATGEQFSGRDHSISSRVVSALVARSNQHDHIVVRRQQDSWNRAHSFPLSNSQIRLFEIKPFLNALAFDYCGKTSALRIEFPNQSGLDVEAYRIMWRQERVSIPGASSGMQVDLVDLAQTESEDLASSTLERLTGEDWALPPLREGHLYLAIDSSSQAAPCLVKGSGVIESGESRTFKGCIAVSDKDERANSLLALFQRITTKPNEGFNSGQIEECLTWMGRLQSVLQWLDPFLVLASNPVLAVRFLALATLRKHTAALQGLQWGLDEVPLFWHHLTALDSASVVEWANAEFGAEGQGEVLTLLIDLPMQAATQQLAGGDLTALKAKFEARRDQWQICVRQWSDLSRGLTGIRSTGIGTAAASVWNNIVELKQLKSLLETRCQQVPHSSVDMHRTYLLAPFELAICTTYRLDMPPVLRDDLIYARYAISPEAFDDAFCVATILMERTK